MERLVRGRPLVPGAAAGAVLSSEQPLSFWGGYDQRTGEIIDRRHPLSGRNAAGTVLVLPASRGSSTTSAVLLEAVRAGTAPAAIVTLGPDRFLALASIVALEMFQAPVPMVAVEAADFAIVRAAAFATVESDGTIRCDGSGAGESHSEASRHA